MNPRKQNSEPVNPCEQVKSVGQETSAQTVGSIVVDVLILTLLSQVLQDLWGGLSLVVGLHLSSLLPFWLPEPELLDFTYQVRIVLERSV